MAGANPRKSPQPLQPPVAAAGKHRRSSEETAAANAKMPPRTQQPPRELLQPLHVVGDEVEVLIRRKLNGLGDSWFPATVGKVVDEVNYEVVLRHGEEGPKTCRVSCDKVRPAADAERFPPGTKLEPRAAVEAFCLGAWSRGEVVGRVDDDNSDDDRYLLKVGSKRRRETTAAEVMELKDLRPPSNKKQANFSKLPSSTPIEVTSDDDESNNYPEYSEIENAMGEPQLLPMVLAQGSEHASNPIEALTGNNDCSSNNVSGLAIHGSSMKVVTNLKSLRRKQPGFKKPSSQHRSLEGSVVLEEGPLGLMQSFNNIIESVLMQSPIEDSEASFQERNLIFSQMKANLEYVQSCHHRMTEEKSEYTKQIEEKDAVEAQQQEKRNSISQLHSSLDENDGTMAEFQQKVEQLLQIIEQLRQKGQKIEEDIQHEESELKRLEEVGRGIKKACDNHKQVILSIFNEVRQKLHNA